MNDLQIYENLGSDSNTRSRTKRHASKTQFKDFCDRLSFVSKIHFSQKGECIQDAVSSLWLGAGTCYTTTEHDTMVSLAATTPLRTQNKQARKQGNRASLHLVDLEHITHAQHALLSWQLPSNSCVCSYPSDAA